MIFFSVSLITGPYGGAADDASTVSSRAAAVMTEPFSRAVSSAASLRTLARSAPDIPTVRLARPSRSASSQRLALRMDAEDSFAACQIRAGHRNLPVETTRPKQGRVEDVRPVGGGDQNDASPLAEAVHLDQQLVERLFTLVMSTAETRTTLTADGVDLVDEDDARRILLRLFEQIANTRGADADEHLGRNPNPKS